MKRNHSSYRFVWTAAVLMASPMLAGANGGGCSPGGKISVGSGDDGGGCTQADCAGLPVLADAKLCPDGTNVGRSVCAKSPYAAQCEWDFPACPPLDAATACECAGPAPGAPNGVCADGSISGPVCVVNPGAPLPGMSAPPVTCSWALRSCPDAGACPQYGCLPQCPNGVVKDKNGCDTCQCAPAADSGGGPASDGGGCTQADCAGLPVLADAKLCTDGTSVGRSVCAKSPYTARCGWDFPACPPLDAATSCVCATPAPGAPNGICPDGSVFGPACVVNTAPPTPGMPAPPITCSWAIRTCPSVGDAGVASCDARKTSALAAVQTAIDANLTCAVDSDCNVVNLQSGCFDACTRIVNVAGVAAAQSAIDGVNANGCSSFVSDGCILVRPPCVPPQPPVCAGGRCM